MGESLGLYPHIHAIRPCNLHSNPSENHMNVLYREDVPEPILVIDEQIETRRFDVKDLRSRLPNSVGFFLCGTLCCFVCWSSPCSASEADAVTGVDTIYVDRFDDPLVPFFGSTCTLTPNDCSLRGAIHRANLTPAMEEIRLNPGTYVLTQEGVDDDDGYTGDLDIFSPMTIYSTGNAGNTVIDAGGIDRVFDISSNPYIEVIFTGITIRNGNEGSGGGIYARAADLTLDACRVVDNSASNYGGGIRSYISYVWIRNGSEISNNSSDYAGGGLALLATSLTIDDSTISDNTAARGGGIDLEYFDVFDADVTITRSTISGNTASYSAGALSVQGDLIYSSPVDVELVNSTVWGNSAPTYPSISVSDVGGLSMHSVNISGNSTVGSASAVRVHDGYFNVTNSLLHGTCVVNDYNVTVVSNGGNLESPGHSCQLTDYSDQDDVADPKLSSLGDFGGPTWTVLPLDDSPALGGASNYCLDNDQRGRSRPGIPGVCDTGSVELQDDDPFFPDGFESADTSYWTTAVF